jgi:cytoskeletal protein RodZ
MPPDSGRLRVVAPTDPRDDLVVSGDGEGSPAPGRYIREQRQRQGMSLDQLAAATKIPRASLEMLEEGRYEELPGPVFVKGFLRCAARSLGLDPEAVMELLYEQERQALHAKRRDRTAPSPVSADVPEPVAPRLPPRMTSGTGAMPRVSPLQRMVESLPAATTLLWVVVIAVLVMIVMAAFNLLGTAGGSVAT